MDDFLKVGEDYLAHHGVAPDNVASQKLAEKNRWKYSDKDSDKDWKVYRKQ